MIWKGISALASPAGHNACLSVLIFHRVLSKPDPIAPWEPTVDRFERIVWWLRGQFHLLPLAEAVGRLSEGTLPAAAASITFDDGYRDNFQLAAPVLRRFGAPATFFVASSFLDGGVMWNDVVIESIRRTKRTELSLGDADLPPLRLDSLSDRHQAIDSALGQMKYMRHDSRTSAAAALAQACDVEPPADLMMESAHVRQLADMGFDIGAHTETHPILTSLPDEAALSEIKRGRERLEAITGRRVGLFAYPNGHWGHDLDQRHVGMVKQLGFDAAFTTDPGVSRRSSDRFALPRFTPWDRQRWRFQLRLLANMRRRSGEPQRLDRVAPQ